MATPSFPRSSDALPELNSAEGPFEWARRLLPEKRRLLSSSEALERARALAERPEVEAWEPPKAVADLVPPEAGPFPPYLFMGEGPVRVALIASPHADEPAGAASAFALMEGLLEDPNRPLLKKLRLAVAPLANPRGYAANEAWFSAANALEAREPGREFKMRMMSAPKIRALEKPRPGNLELADAVEAYAAAYLRHRRRSPPEADVEFGYAPPGSDPADPKADFLPECRRHAAFIDEACSRWGGLDLICPLHSMGVAGGAWALLRTGDPANPGPDAEVFMAPFKYAAALCGLGLHDEDRRGEKGFWRLGPGFHTTPTVEAMQAYFVARDAWVDIRHNSMQYAGDRARRAAVPEIPLFLCRALNDASPAEETVADVAAQTSNAAREALEHLWPAKSAPDSPEKEAALARREYFQQIVRARENDAAAPEAASKQAFKRERAKADNSSLAWPAMAESMLAAAEKREPRAEIFQAAARHALDELNWRPVSLKHQMLLQLALVLGGVRDLAS